MSCPFGATWTTLRSLDEAGHFVVATWGVELWKTIFERLADAPVAILVIAASHLEARGPEYELERLDLTLSKGAAPPSRRRLVALLALFAHTTDLVLQRCIEAIAAEHTQAEGQLIDLFLSKCPAELAVAARRSDRDQEVRQRSGCPWIVVDDQVDARVGAADNGRRAQKKKCKCASHRSSI